MSQSRSGRTVSVALIVALVAAMVLWLRNRSRPIQVGDPPEWPPLPPTDDAAPADEPQAEADAAPTADEPQADVEADPGAAWRPADAEGNCPEGFPIKANDKSGIFHVPGGRFYDRTKPERCYPDAGSALADGYRQAKT